jgi:hypothetical protein
MRISIALAIALASAPAFADPDHCRLAVELAKKNDLPRAGLHYEACTDRDSEELRALARRLDHSELARIAVSTDPGVVVEISALPGETFESAVWVPAGTYEVRGTTPDGAVVTTTFAAKPYSRGTVILDVPKPKAPPPPKEVVIDVGAGGGDIGEIKDGPPPDIKHKTLLPKKYVDGGTVGGEAIPDPFELREPSHADGAADRPRLGLRVGFGVASDTDTVTAFTLGVVGSRPLAPGLRALARLEWTRRSNEMGALDAIAASGGVAARLATTSLAVVEASAALRPELRLGDTFLMRDVHRIGLAGDIGLDIVMRGAPVVVGVRGDLGLTRLADGIRERALLLELTFELR